MEIIANNGRVYKDLRAYHIALGHAVRQALIDFSKEVEEYCQTLINNFYAEYNPKDYSRTGQLLSKMRLGELIKTKIQGSFQGKYVFEYSLFDWNVLDAHSNGVGEFGTYTSFDGVDVRDEMEIFLQNGIYGHNGLDLYADIDKYINDHLDERIQKVIDNF